MSRSSSPTRDGCGTPSGRPVSDSRKDRDHVSNQNRQQQKLIEALASLQLPQAPARPVAAAVAKPSGPVPVPVPTPGDSSPHSAAAAAASSPPPAALPASLEHPTITLLVAADIDLASASELSEYALRNRLHVDLCIACGPFCRDEDLARAAMASSSASSNSSTLYGRSACDPRRGSAGLPDRGGGVVDAGSAPIDRAMASGGRGGLRSIMALSGPSKSHSPDCWYPRRSAAAAGPAKDSGSAAEAGSSSGGGSSERRGWDATPLFRTREQTSALEGLMTATLSQLENIVCRVVYCPGSTDPITSCLGQESSPASGHLRHPRRYTPNSRNVHRQWLPLAPGLGAAALLYLDCSEELVQDATAALMRWSSAAPGGGKSSRRKHDGDYDNEEEDDDGEDDDEDEDDNEANENIALWIEQLQQLSQQCQGYRSKLERLLTLAPPVQHAVRFAQPSQTILVTHYVDCTPFLAPDNRDPAESSSPSQSPSPASPLHYYTLASPDKRRASRSPVQPPPPVNGAPPWAFESTDSHAVSAEDDDDDDDEDKNHDDDDGVAALDFAEANPWPKEHEAFRASSLAQDRMCLEIASGCPLRRPEVRTTGPNQTVLIPGSLRERGEFSVVQVSLRETPLSRESGDANKRPAANASAAASGGEGEGERRNFKPTAAPSLAPTKQSSNHKRTFSWVVQNVDFHRLGGARRE